MADSSGIKQLCALLTQSNILKHVDLTTEKRKEGQNRELVFDGRFLECSFYHHKNMSDWVRGGQFEELRGAVSAFVSGIKACGFDVTVAFESCVCPSRRPQWFSRTQANDTIRHRIIQHLYAQQESTERNDKPPSHSDTSLSWVPVDVSRALRQSFHMVGANILYMDQDPAREMAIYTIKKKCYAIVSDDPSFLIYPVERCFPRFHFRSPSSISGECYMREDVIHSIMQVPDSHVTLLGSLIFTLISSRNNDDDDDDDEEGDDEKQKKTDGNNNEKRVTIQALQEYLHDLSVEFCRTCENNALNSIAPSSRFRRMMREFHIQPTQIETLYSYIRHFSTTNSKQQQQIEASSTTTDYPPISTEPPLMLASRHNANSLWTNIVQRYRRGQIHSTLFEILSYGTISVGPTLEDDLGPPSWLVVRPLVRRLYAMLLPPTTSSSDADTDADGEAGNNTPKKITLPTTSMTTTSGLPAYLNLSVDLPPSSQQKQQLKNPIEIILHSNIYTTKDDDADAEDDSGVDYHGYFSVGPLDEEDDDPLPPPSSPHLIHEYAYYYGKHMDASSSSSWADIADPTRDLSTSSTSSSSLSSPGLPGVPMASILAGEEGAATPIVDRLYSFLSVGSASDMPLAELIALRAPPVLIMVCVAVRYLINSPMLPHLIDRDVDGIIAQAVVQALRPSNPTPPDDTDKAPTAGLAIYPVVVHLSSVYLRLMDVLCMVNDACGRPLQVRGPWQYYDGVSFHRKWLDARDGVLTEKLLEVPTAPVAAGLQTTHPYLEMYHAACRAAMTGTRIKPPSSSQPTPPSAKQNTSSSMTTTTATDKGTGRGAATIPPPPGLSLHSTILSRSSAQDFVTPSPSTSPSTSPSLPPPPPGLGLRSSSPSPNNGENNIATTSPSSSSSPSPLSSSSSTPPLVKQPQQPPPQQIAKPPHSSKKLATALDNRSAADLKPIRPPGVPINRPITPVPSTISSSSSSSNNISNSNIASNPPFPPYNHPTPPPTYNNINHHPHHQTFTPSPSYHNNNHNYSTPPPFPSSTPPPPPIKVVIGDQEFVLASSITAPALPVFTPDDPDYLDALYDTLTRNFCMSEPAISSVMEVVTHPNRIHQLKSQVQMLSAQVREYVEMMNNMWQNDREHMPPRHNMNNNINNNYTNNDNNGNADYFNDHQQREHHHHDHQYHDDHRDDHYRDDYSHRDNRYRDDHHRRDDDDEDDGGGGGHFDPRFPYPPSHAMDRHPGPYPPPPSFRSHNDYNDENDLVEPPYLSRRNTMDAQVDNPTAQHNHRGGGGLSATAVPPPPASEKAPTLPPSSIKSPATLSFTPQHHGCTSR
eukprot:TRINITY_DN9294_c0_g1_i9.p1 TRINITY_DN9294_c0_g1~~TRINITY_DN9294_c0_g1_i9.p1  ORF type:complete len:1339 (+),score=308.89 TRINITY_DN9294_c0_g1_i9:50-4018(+)